MNGCSNSPGTQKGPDNSWPGPTDEGGPSQSCSLLSALHLLAEFFDFVKDICEPSKCEILVTAAGRAPSVF